MTKTIYVIFLCINCIVCKANNNRIIVWNQDFKCIVNQLITKEHSVCKILQKIADTTINKFAKIPNYDNKGNYIDDSLIKTPTNYIVYIGKKIQNSKCLDTYTNYLIKLKSDDVFYTTINSGWYRQIQKDSSFIEMSCKDNHIYKTKTILPDGEWHLYEILNKTYFKNKEIKIKNHNVEGYVKKYMNGILYKLSKYKHGVLVDTYFRYNNHQISSMEIRSSDGFEFLKSISYYPKSKNISYYYDNIIGYKIKFYENGQILSFVKEQNNNRFGTYLEFDENYNIIKRKEYPPPTFDEY